ncbi:MlaE family lipid ABC transporter permease subunit [Hydrogenimonas sp.]|uniref:ABC transporter permease n=1 Tax=Hydrogenimonas sp. TaxID=2231112 RepID=UPI00261FD547|nr:MlaE family lipid ABC transporter permease subunit [Hydrogenimonas sp.]
MTNGVFFHIGTEEGQTTLRLAGSWRVDRLDRIEEEFDRILPELKEKKEIRIDLSGIDEIDTGAMVFFIAMRERLKKSARVRATGGKREFCRMFRLVKHYNRPLPVTKEPAFAIVTKFVAGIGEAGVAIFKDFVLFLNFLGAATIAFFESVLHPGTIRLKETSSNIYKAGTTAIPIVALSSFLVGVVIAYQSAVQLEKYGANIFIVDMIGISIPRELAPLITAIIVAGRSGSAYTAQIGVMKITEEIDAMKTMGFEIYRFVVLPRIFAMIVALPLLIFFADIVGIYAGMIVAKAQLGINMTQFLDRLQNAVEVKHYLVGVFKGPFFAFIIAAIGCFRGFQVSGNTESIGRYTTMSVVNAIFLVVAVDALFSVIFTELGI